MFLGQNGSPCAGKHFEVYGAYWYACVFIFSVCARVPRILLRQEFFMSRAFWRLCDARHAFARCGNASSHNFAVLSLTRSRNFDPCLVCFEKVSLHWILDRETVGRYRSALIVWNVKGDTDYLLGKTGSNGICTSRLALSQAHAHSTPQFLAGYAWHHSSSQWATSSSTRAFCDRAEPLILDSKAREDIISSIL